MLPMLLDQIANHRRLEATTFPTVDVLEQKDCYEFRFDLPGVAREKLSIGVEGTLLTLKGERETAENLVRAERWSGAFERRFELPENVDSTRIEARLRDGVLTLVLPKAEAAKPRQIEIKG